MNIMNIPTFSKVPCYENEVRGHANYIPPMQNAETVPATPHVNSDVADGVVQTCGGLAMCWSMHKSKQTFQ